MTNKNIHNFFLRVFLFVLDICAEKAVNLEHLSKQLFNGFPKGKSIYFELFTFFFLNQIISFRSDLLIWATHQLFSYINFF